MQLWSEGNATFISTVTDSGQSSGIDADDYSLTVTRSSGAQYKFVPATKDGHPVSMWMQLEYNFNLY